MKKSLLLSASLLTLGLVTGIYAQATGVGGSLGDTMKAATHFFTLAGDLNPGQTGLASDPVKGKKTGDILTAGEWNRMLELTGEGGSGSGCTPSANDMYDSGWQTINSNQTIVLNHNLGTTDTIVDFQIKNNDAPFVFYTAQGQVATGNILPGDGTGSAISWLNKTDNQISVWRNTSGYNISGFRIIMWKKSAIGAGCAGGSSGGASWVDVPLTDTAPYDHNNCQYRAKITGPAYNATYGFSADAYYPADYVAAGALMLDSGIFIRASDKAKVYIIDQTNNNILDVTTAWGWKTTKIEKLCGTTGASGASGSGGGNTFTFLDTEVLLVNSGVTKANKATTTLDISTKAGVTIPPHAKAIQIYADCQNYANENQHTILKIGSSATTLLRACAVNGYGSSNDVDTNSLIVPLAADGKSITYEYDVPTGGLGGQVAVSLRGFIVGN